MSFILCWGEVRTLHPVSIPILVARATDVKNEHQSQNHAACLLKNVIGGGGGGEGRDAFAWFSETRDFIALWSAYLSVLRESAWEPMLTVANTGTP